MLVLDEPTAFLDLPSRVELMGLLRQLTRDAPLAVVVSTHDLELALRTADVVWLVMPGGELVTGAPEDVIVSGAIALFRIVPRRHPEAALAPALPEKSRRARAKLLDRRGFATGGRKSRNAE
mgnify:CR=1 FL=1